MTDQQMDARLRAAGERFRAANPGPAPAVDSVDVAEVTPTSGGHRHQWLLTAAAAAVVALVVGLTLALRGSAPTRPPSADNAGLVGNVWLLTSGAKPSTTALYISRSGVLVADDECQLISSEVHISGPRITFADPAVRLKPCLDPGFAPAFNGIGARVLRGKATFRIDSRGMTITHPGVGSLRFLLAQTPIPPPSPDIPTLTGTDWVAPNGKVLHIDPITGQLSGGYCSGRARVVQITVSFTDCPAAGMIRFAVVTGSTLTLKGVIGNAPPSSVPPLVFRWRPTSASIDPASLTGRTWHLETVAGRAASSGSLRIDGSTAVVDDGCTTYRRSVSVGSGTFTIAGGVPAHACTDQATTADSFVFNDPATWAIRAGKLIVYGGGSQEFALVYGKTAHQQPMHDPSELTRWVWRLAETRLGPVEHKAIGEVTLRFPDDSTLSVTRCYTSQAKVDVNSSSMTVRHLHTTAAPPCPSGPHGTQDQNSLIDSVLDGALAWKDDADRLTISKGATALIFAREPALVGTRWSMTFLVPGTGTAPGYPTKPVPIEFSARSVSSGRYFAGAAITSDTIRFGKWVADGVAPVRSLLGKSGQAFVNNQLLHGITRYRISGNTLTIEKPGVGQATFTRRR